MIRTFWLEGILYHGFKVALKIIYLHQRLSHEISLPKYIIFLIGPCLHSPWAYHGILVIETEHPFWVLTIYSMEENFYPCWFMNNIIYQWFKLQNCVDTLIFTRSRVHMMADPSNTSNPYTGKSCGISVISATKITYQVHRKYAFMYLQGSIYIHIRWHPSRCFLLCALNGAALHSNWHFVKPPAEWPHAMAAMGSLWKRAMGKSLIIANSTCFCRAYI